MRPARPCPGPGPPRRGRPHHHRLPVPCRHPGDPASRAGGADHRTPLYLAGRQRRAHFADPRLHADLVSDRTHAGHSHGRQCRHPDHGGYQDPQPGDGGGRSGQRGAGSPAHLRARPFPRMGHSRRRHRYLDLLADGHAGQPAHTAQAGATAVMAPLPSPAAAGPLARPAAGGGARLLHQHAQSAGQRRADGHLRRPGYRGGGRLWRRLQGGGAAADRDDGALFRAGPLRLAELRGGQSGEGQGRPAALHAVRPAVPARHLRPRLAAGAAHRQPVQRSPSGRSADRDLPASGAHRLRFSGHGDVAGFGTQRRQGLDGVIRLQRHAAVRLLAARGLAGRKTGG